MANTALDDSELEICGIGFVLISAARLPDQFRDVLALHTNQRCAESNRRETLRPNHPANRDGTAMKFPRRLPNGKQRAVNVWV